MSSIGVVWQHDMASDHYPLGATFQFSSKKTVGGAFVQQTPRLDMARADWDYFRLLLSNIKIDQTNDDIDILNHLISTGIITSAEKSIPYKTSRIRGKTLPKWILDFVKQRRKARTLTLPTNAAKFTVEEQEVNKVNYNRLSNLVKDEVRKERNRDWKAFVDKLGPNPISSAPLWNRVNQLRGLKSSKKIPTLNKNDIIYDDDTKKADLFRFSQAPIFFTV